MSNTNFWKIEKRKTAILKDFNHNPRIIGKKYYELLKKNIKKYGLIDRPFINTDNTIIGGHLRTQILQELGLKEIEVFVAPRKLSLQEMKELCIKHNKIVGDWDFDILANQYEFDDLMQWGFEEKQFVEEEKRKRKTKPKFVIEFVDKEDLSLFIKKHHQQILDLTADMKTKIKLLGVEDV